MKWLTIDYILKLHEKMVQRTGISTTEMAEEGILRCGCGDGDISWGSGYDPYNTCDPCISEPCNFDPNDNIFDYIVIGAGTAGGVIAKKLTDDKRTSVLVLEAGTNLTNELSSPSLEGYIGGR